MDYAIRVTQGWIRLSPSNRDEVSLHLTKRDRDPIFEVKLKFGGAVYHEHSEGVPMLDVTRTWRKLNG